MLWLHCFLDLNISIVQESQKHGPFTNSKDFLYQINAIASSGKIQARVLRQQFSKLAIVGGPGIIHSLFTFLDESPIVLFFQLHIKNLISKATAAFRIGVQYLALF